LSISTPPGRPGPYVLAASLLTHLGLKAPVKALIQAVKTIGLPKVTPIIEEILPHDADAFTQGLFYGDGLLYESTGLENRSSLRCIDPQSGALLKSIHVREGWAEGLTGINRRLVQLTWRHGKAYVYQMPNLSMCAEWTYSGEGWGLTHDSHNFIMSNGTNVLCYRDADFQVTRILKVRLNGWPLRGLNDLQFANGRIYANVLYDTNIYEISQHTGKVRRVIDCSQLLALERPADSEHVMNGMPTTMFSACFF